jgi:Asp-tRNA(Asn)/Glu-tRNA(Gln) amidotransferase A subunit family amidase
VWRSSGGSPDEDANAPSLDTEGLTARNVNKHRQLLAAMFNYGCRSDTYVLPANPAAGTNKRLEGPPSALDYYEVEEVEALAGAWAGGERRKHEVTHQILASSPPAVMRIAATRTPSGSCSTPVCPPLTIAPEEIDSASGSPTRRSSDRGSVSAPIAWRPVVRNQLTASPEVADADPAAVPRGARDLVVRGDAFGTNHKRHYSTDLVDFYGRARREHADQYSITVKMTILMGHWLSERYHHHYYAKAQNLGRRLRASYDEALERDDVLVLPTTAMKAMPIPTGRGLMDILAAALGNLHNTAAFDVTGNPALSVPCGMSDGRPIGMMMIGRHFDDATVLRAGHAYQRASPS